MTVVGGEQGRDSRSVLGLRVWLARHPLRLAPAWATLAGALASGGLRWQREDGLLLLLAIFLSDGLWGQLWTLLARQDSPASQESATNVALMPPLPYAAPAAPASRLWRWLAGDSGQGEAQPTTAWRALLMAALFSFGLALLLGPAALLLTVVALPLAGLARYLPRRSFCGALVQAVFEIGLAWLLGHLLFAGLRWPPIPLVVAAGYVWLHMGALALCGRRGLWLVNLAQLIPLACLVALKRPLAAGALGVTLLPPLAWQPWLRGEGDEGGFDTGEYLQRAQVWWWAGMLLAAWAIAG